uniref:CAB/ELIP/HLIP superfamily protein n=1 Tax=Gelidium gabrielsonii TaxID=2483892 RepID=A0A3G2QXG3_9FLOR|nr:CAB/ELIP/HLIP superfamily protein [Gelidium gabrielsonii]AYO27747.1 CAB/ELIP/HLIP superfamily protein [Gelidium gabrielsonii]
MYRNQWIWGFSLGAENWNGRLAMIAFIIIFIIELFFSISILRLIGIYSKY